ncbi:MAG: hypothetical protein M3X11_23830, partial [Acidobacteriota bacterium]|nr:hypothetical protein [Acidobacteriota bacterium]
MKRITLSTALLLIVYLAAAILPLLKIGNAAQRQPNIIFIYADDLGYGDLGSYGATAIKTPNLDR